MLVSIKFGDVDIDEPHGWVLERGLRRAGKIAVARANTDDQIRFSGQNVRTWRSCHPDGPELLRVIVNQRALPRLCLTNRNSGLRNKLGKRFRSLGVEQASAGNDQRLA